MKQSIKNLEKRLSAQGIKQYAKPLGIELVSAEFNTGRVVLGIDGHTFEFDGLGAAHTALVMAYTMKVGGRVGSANRGHSMTEEWRWVASGMENVKTGKQNTVSTTYVMADDYKQLQQQYAAAVKASSASAGQLLRLRALCQEIFEPSAGLCQRCSKRQATEDHPCPYQSDINDDRETMCNCCEDCSQQCVDDI
jgi:hypothetical protein